MAVPVLRTKLYLPPVRAALVSRPHLAERLEQGLAPGCRLILVSAPAGFGKTTLVADWALSRRAASPGTPPPSGQPLAWLSLDQDDNDPARFWTYLTAALQGIDPGIGGAVMSALETPALGAGIAPPSAEAIVTTLINQIAERQEACILVLDDYQLIENPSIHDGLTYLLDHMPPRFHLAILSRVDPPLPLARLRARSQLVELRSADLRFKAEEVASFLNAVMGLDLAPTDIAALEARTEGWIVGLQMAALSLQGEADKHRFIDAFAGSDRYVADYLVQDVVQRQPPDVQAFLLQTSILERLCGPLCDAVRGIDASRAQHDPEAPLMPSQEILEYLEHANLFVEPLDAQRHWYRYHGLFAGLLRQRLRASSASSMAGNSPAQLHERASAWYEAEGLTGEAISHALAASAYERAALLIEAHALPALCRGEMALVQRWLSALPESLVLARPTLCLAYAWCELLGASAGTERVSSWLARAEQAAPGPAREADGTRVYADTLRAYLAFDAGEAPQAVIERADQALAQLPQEEDRVRSTLYLVLGQAHLAYGDLAAADMALARARQCGERDSPYIAILATYLQAHIARERGQLHKAAALCQDALRSLVDPPGHERGRPVYGAEMLYVVLGSVLIEWNDLEAAAAALGKADEQMGAGLRGHPISEIEERMWMARLRHAQGDWAGAQAVLEEGIRAPASPAGTAFIPHLAALRAWLWLGQAEALPACLAQAAQWAQESQTTLDREPRFVTILPTFERDWERLTLARLRITEYQVASRAAERPDLQSVLRFLDEQLAQAGKRGWGARTIEVLALRTLALQAMGQPDAALVTLQRALSLAEPESYVRVFLEGGTPMARLLYQAAQEEVAPGYAARLLAAWPSAPAARPVASVGFQGSPSAEEGLVEPLSERELEVLSLIEGGLSNQEIAQRLYISVGTVKVHSSHIYGKLGVRRRTEAVSRARALGILPHDAGGHDPPRRI